jgi:hypothetical protein
LLLIIVSGGLIAGIQKTRISSEGIFINGLVYKWSDFENYTWKEYKADFQQLTLTTNKNVWLVRQVELKVPSKSKDQVELFIAQELKKASVSA